MADNFACRKPSIDYFSLTRTTSETGNPTYSSTWDQSPYSNPTLQSPLSCDSQNVSPVSPLTTPFSSVHYALPFQHSGVDRKGDQALNSSFEDWMQWDNSTDNTLYPSIKPEPINLKLEPKSPTMDAIEYSGALAMTYPSTIMPNGFDDGTAIFQDSMTEEELFQSPHDISSQQMNDLYANHLAWSQSQLNYQATQQINSYPQITPADTPKLINNAMPTSSVSKVPLPSQESTPQRKRKSSSSSASSSSSSASSDPPPRRNAPVKKTAHNMIEKRYRTNLNDKIAALRDSVPNLRITEKISNGHQPTEEDLEGLEVAHKLNKATILSKATEYIAHLESRNSHLSKECQILKDRIDAFEVLLMSRSGSGSNLRGLGSHTTPGFQQNHKSKWKHQQPGK